MKPKARLLHLPCSIRTRKVARYPDKNLAGVGVAFKLVHALFRERGREAQVSAFMKVVAIGTVADVAKLMGENRTIVALGLKDLARAANPGLQALIDVAGCGDGKGMTAYDLGFRLGPRINAAGRMDAASAVVELFDTRDSAEARRLAEHLDARNEERKTVQQQIIDLAVAELEEDSGTDAYVAVIAGEGWHRGVIGIAASKIAERLNRPCVVLSVDGDVAHGSGRSIEAYHLLNGLTACADLFEKFGGHSHAAGITIRPERIAEFRRRLNEHAASCLTRRRSGALGDDRYGVAGGECHISRWRKSFRRWSRLAQGIRVRCLRRGTCAVCRSRYVLKERHLKLRLAGPQNRPLEAIWCNCMEPGGQTPDAERAASNSLTRSS